MTSLGPNILIPFLEGSSSEVKYAASLASLVDRPLYVLVEDELFSAAVLAGVSEETILSRIHKRLSGLGVSNLRIVEKIPTGAICISNDLWKKRDDISILSPGVEESVFGRSSVRGEIMLPFGARHSAIRASLIAVSLAKSLGVGLLFYHTTWKEEGVSSTDPSDHMCLEAKENLSKLSHLAELSGVPHRSIVECADSIIKGIPVTALSESVSLVLMARNPNTGTGCHADQLLMRDSPVPILVIGSKEGNNA